MTINWNKRFQDRDYVCNRFKEVYSNAEYFGYSDLQLHEKINTVLSSKEYKALPFYMRSYCDGYLSMIRDSFWRKMITKYNFEGQWYTMQEFFSLGYGYPELAQCKVQGWFYPANSKLYRTFEN